jgi:hypothetical protein
MLATVGVSDRQLQGGECGTANVSGGSIRARRAWEDQSFAVRGRMIAARWSAVHALLTVMAALAAGLDVGLMALTVGTPGSRHRLLTLRNRH